MSKLPKANPRGGRQMYVPGASPEAQNANLRTVVDELRAHTSQLKKELELERGQVKELRREKQTEVKNTRDQEQQKASSSLSELRAKLNHEKQRELAALRESLTKQHDQAINRLLKQKQELLARTQSDSQREREIHYLKVKQQVWVEAKEEVKRTFEMDKGKLLAEIDELRRGKKRVEEELNEAVAGDRQRAIDLRKQWGEHQREMEQLKKDARRDIQRLMEELKSKDYTISELEKELGYKSGYTKRLQGEKDSLGNLLNLSKMAESWDHRSSSTPESSFGSSSGLQFAVSDRADEDEKKFNKKISDLKGMLRKLEERNKQLVEDKADLERKIRNSTEARNTTPLIEKNKRLLRKIKDLEQLKKKLDERNKALSEENQKLRTLKENMRCRLERENQSLRKVLSKERQQTQQEASNSSRTGDDPIADKEEELKKLRIEVQEQFLEIVELKQAALEQDRLPKVQDPSPSLLTVPNFRPRSSSLTPFNCDDDVGVRSRSGSFGTPIPSPLALSDCEDSLDEVSVDEMMDGLATRQLADAKQMEKLLQQNKELEEQCTKLQWQLQDSKDQSELLEFRILELEEEEENLASTPTPQTTAENNQRVLSLEGLVLEKDSLIQHLQQEVESQRECVKQMEDTQEQLISMRRSQKLTNEDSPSLLHQLQLAKMRVADLERTEAHLNTRIHELEDQLAHLQEDIHLGLAERNRERAELEAEISSLQETTEGLQRDQAQVADRLKSAEECRQSWLEEEEKLQKKLKKKELTETSYKKQIEKLKSELLALQEMASLEGLTPPHVSNNTNGNNNSGNMEESQDVTLLQQKIKELELVRESLEAKLKDVEVLVLNSDFASEETLRGKIADLEQSNKLLNRQLKQAQASGVDKKEDVERAAAEARHTEKEFQVRIKELQQSEQNLLDRVAQLETQDNAWMSQVDSLQDRIQDLEGLRLELKGKLDQAEEHIEELQVAEKFARDELSASHGASSILGESLGLMGEFGELGALAEEEYIEYEEDDVQDTAAQSGGGSETEDPGLQENNHVHGVREAEPDMHSKVAELDKSEVELMEKVQSLEQVNLELTDLCQELQDQASEFADENETLKQKLLNLEELQLQIPETSKGLEETEEKEVLKIKVEELQSEIELLKQRNNDGHRDRDESALQNEHELSEELEVVKEENLELLDRLSSEHTKLQEMKKEWEKSKKQHQDAEDNQGNNAIGSDFSLEELQQDLERCRTEKAQLEEHFQTEIKELNSLLDGLRETKEDLEQQLKSSEDELVRLEEVSAELHTELESRIKELEDEKEDLQNQLEALEQNSRSSGSEIKQKELEEENQILLSRVTNAEEQCQKLKEQVETLEKRLQDRHSDLTIARKDSMRKSLECDDSSRELADLKKRLKELEDVESDFFDQAEVLAKMEKEQEGFKNRLEGFKKNEEEIIEQSTLLELKNEELEEIQEFTKELKIDLEESQQKIAEQSNLLLDRNKELDELRDATKALEAAKEDLQEKLDFEVKLLEESKGELLNLKKELDTATEDVCQQREELEEKEIKYREMKDRLNQMEKGEDDKLKVADNIEKVSSVGLLEQRIEELTQQEKEHLLKIEELEERQVAFEDTIAQADIIVSEVQQKLSEQNELLAAKDQELQEAIDHLESQTKTVGELSDKLQQLEDTSHELDKKNEQLEIGQKKLKELKDSLKECEVECQVKEEKLHKLRETEVSLTLKVESLELSKQVRAEDTIIPVIEAKVMASQESTVEATNSADGVDFSGQKITEEDLQERIKELEDGQSAFQETLAQAETVLEGTNQKLCEKSEKCDVQEREMMGLRDTVAVLKEDKLKLQSHLEAADDELEKKDHSLKESCSEVDNLKEQLQTLTEKLTSSERTCNQLAEMENFESNNKQAGFEDDFSQEESVEFLKKRVSELTSERDELQWKVKDLEERQEAFQETLAQADVIMTERESGFLERIDELESSQSNLQERLHEVNASKSMVRTSQSSDEDDDVQEFSIFTPHAKVGDLENFEKTTGEKTSVLEKKIQELQEEVEELRVSEKELLKIIEDYKTLENSLRVSNNEMKEELGLAREEIKQLEISLEDGGPDNNLQAQLEELKSGVLSHDDTNLKLREEIDTLKGTIADLQDQLLRSPNQQISFDGFVTPKAANVKTELTKPKIIISEDNSDLERESLFDQDSLQEQIKLLESKLCDVKDQLEKVTFARDSLQSRLEEKEVTVEKLEKANKYLQDDIDICSTQMEELEQQLSQSSKEDNRVTSSSPESESQSQPQSIKELKETVADLRMKLLASEREKVELQEQNVNPDKERKDLENSAQQLKMRDLECSVATLEKELQSANSDRVKTTNRLTEIVQFNREIKKDMRDLEESGKILEEENRLMKREKEILNEKLLTFGICGEDLLKDRMKNEGFSVAVAEKETTGKKKMGGYQSAVCVDKVSQTGPLTYLPSEFLLTTVLIEEELEMTLKEFLEALPAAQSPTDPILLKEGKNYFVEFNKLFSGKDPAPRKALLRRLVRNIPRDKIKGINTRKDTASYPPIPGEENLEQEMRGSPESSARPLDGAGSAIKRQMLDQFVAALWELPFEHLEINLDAASCWCPDDYDDDSLATVSECEHEEVTLEESTRNGSVYADAPPLPQATPPVPRKRSGSISSDSLAGDFTSVPSGYRRVIRDDSLELEDEDEDDGGTLTPTLSTSSFPWRSETNLSSPGEGHSGLHESSKQSRPDTYLRSSESPSTRLPISTSLQKSTPSRIDTYTDEMPLSLPRTAPPRRGAETNMESLGGVASQFQRSTPSDYSGRPDAQTNSNLYGSSSYQPETISLSRPDLNLRSQSELPSSTPWASSQGSPDNLLRNSDGLSTKLASPSERVTRSLESSPPPPLPEVSPPNRAYRSIESPPTLPGTSPPSRVHGSFESSNTLPETSPASRTHGSLESSNTLPVTSSPNTAQQGSQSPPTLPDTSPPKKHETYPRSPDGLPPPLPGSSPPKRPNTYPGSPDQTPGDSHIQSNYLNEIHDLPPPLPKTIPPKTPNTPEEFPSSANRQKHESTDSGGRFENHNNIPYQNGHIVSAVTVDLASDSSSTDTVTDHEDVAVTQNGSMGKESVPSWDGRDLSSKSSIVHLPSSFDSGMDTVSSITEQEVEAITAASVFTGPDHSMRLPKTPGLQDVAGSVLAKPATPMWLKQMMDWQTAEKAKEETDIARMKTSIETMEQQLQEKEDVVRELKQSEDNLKKKLRDYGDLRPLTIQLQTKEIDIQDKERQVALLKSEVKQKEREVNALQSKFEGAKVNQIDTNQTDLIKKSTEIANLKGKLEASHDRLKEKEQLLKAKDEEEARIKDEMETKEKELASKEEELQKQSEKIKNLETMGVHQQTPTDHTDTAKSRDTRAPDSRSGDWKSHDALSDDTKPDTSHHASRSQDPRSHDSRSHDVSQQELHLASALNVLTRENEELRGRIQRYAAIEARWDEMHQQLSDSRHSNRDRDALERKLKMAEDMLREKTSEELRLAEDNSALEERVRHLETERRKRDGIEEDYRNIKDQFDDMEHKKNEAEISVAPLQAKVSYLLQKCKERDAIIQKMAAELEQFRPDRTEQLLSEVSDLTAVVNLPSEEFNDPLPVASRSRMTRGSRSRHPQKDQVDISKQQRKLDKISKSLNDIRTIDESDDDELGRIGAARGRSTLDLISGSLDGDSELDGGEISLGELLRRTSGSRSRSHLTPSRRVEEDGELDLLRSVLDASPSKIRSTSSKPGRDNHASSRTNKRTPSSQTPLAYNSLSHHIPVTSRGDGLADLSYMGSSTVSEQDLVDPLSLLPMSTHPALSSSQQHTSPELAHFTSPSGDVNTFIASPVDGIYQMYSSPSRLHPETSAILSTLGVSSVNPSVPNDMTRTTKNHPSQSFGRTLNNYHGEVTPGGQLMTNTNRSSGQSNVHPENGRNSRQNSLANRALPGNGATSVTLQAVNGEGPQGRGPFGLIEGSQSNRDPQIPVERMGEVLSPLVNQQISPNIVSGSTVGGASVISAPVLSKNSLTKAPSTFGGTTGFPVNSHSIDSRSRGTKDLVETTLPPQGQVPSGHVTSTVPAMSNSPQRVGIAAIHHGITSHHGHPVSRVNSTGVQSAPVALSGNQTTLQTSVMSTAFHSENGTRPLSNTILPSNINRSTTKGIESSLVSPGMSSSSVHQKSNAQEIYKSMNTLQMHSGIGASDLNPRVASQPRSASANTPQGYSVASLYDGPSTTVTHLGYQAAGSVSASLASITPQHGLVQSPQNQPQGLQSSTQHHIPNSTKTLPKTQNNGFLNLSSSPTSGGQLMSASSNRTSMSGSSHIPAAATKMSWLPVQSQSPQLPTSLPTSYSSHHGRIGSNGTASSQPHIESVSFRNGTRGIDEPDQSRMIPHSQKTRTNSQGGHQVSSHGGLRQPHLTGIPQPPRSLIVSKVIGCRGAVLTWHPPNLDDLGQSNGLEIVGYKIFVNRQQKQLVTNAHLTKALVDGLNLRTVQTFGIQTVSATGQSSAIVETEFDDPGMLSSSWSDSAMTESSVGRGTVTSQGSSVVSDDLQERLFMAVYNYNPIEHSPNHYPSYEVTFSEGDIVTVYGSIRPDGFYQGKVRGKRGLVPSNFIEEISMSGSHGRKKHSSSKSHKNGSGETHRHREGDRRGSKEAARTSTKTSGRIREDQKRHGSASRV